MSEENDLNHKLQILQEKYLELSVLNEKLLAVQTQNNLISENNEQISFLGMGHINIDKKIYTAVITLGNIGLITSIIFLLTKSK